MIDLTDKLKAELERLAAAESPKECCGLISEDRDGNAVLWPGENVSDDPEDKFWLNPAEQLQILDEIQRLGHEYVGIFHSHPASGPEPSRKDRAIADYWPPGITWVIVGRCDDCEGNGFHISPFWSCVTCDGSGYSFWVGNLP